LIVQAGFMSPVAAAGGPGRAFSSSDKLVAVYLFHWYTPSGGQTQGVWHPLEGRVNWDGSVAFWKRQVKDIMDANVDLIYVHLIPDFEAQRLNLFQALSELRAEGYQVPQVAPWLDPAITFYFNPIDLCQQAGRDVFVAQYIRFYQQYRSKNPDVWGDSFLATMDGKPMLASWALGNASGSQCFLRQHMATPLLNALGPLFSNGIFVTSLGPPPSQPTTWNDGFFWSDEYYRIFVGHIPGQHFLFDGSSASVKPGSWDQLVGQSPERYLARNGGQGYLDGWNAINGASVIKHAHIESWNEYTEGTGLFEADPTRAYWQEDGYVERDDHWGTHARLFIDLTAQESATFNSVPSLAASFLGSVLPRQAEPGAAFAAQVAVRNDGDVQWRGSTGFGLTLDWGNGGSLQSYPLNDGFHEIDSRNDPLFAAYGGYGGVFRGRPIDLQVTATAPTVPGTYTTHWRMAHQGQSVLVGTVYGTLGIPAYGGNYFAGDLGDPKRTADFICARKGFGAGVFYEIADKPAGGYCAYKTASNSPNEGLQGNFGHDTKVISRVVCAGSGATAGFGNTLDQPIKVVKCKQPVTPTTVYATLGIAAYGGNYFAGDLGDVKRTADFICTRKGYAGALSYEIAEKPAGGYCAYKTDSDSPNEGLQGNLGHGTKVISQVVCNTCGQTVTPTTVYATLGIAAYGGNYFAGDLGDVKRTADFICARKGYLGSIFYRIADKPAGAFCAYKTENDSPNEGLTGNLGHGVKILSEVQCSDYAP